ncbi:MAG: ATP-dependent DNA ligase [Jatrophihabitantaceae bacterium]
MPLLAVAATSDELADTASRSAKISRLAQLLASTPTAAQTRIVVSWLSGELTQRQLGVGWAGVRDLPAAAAESSLTVTATEAALDRIASAAGAGSQAVRRTELAALFGAASPSEQSFLRRVITGELRQGALAGVMVDAIAKAAGLGAAQVRRAAMLAGDLAAVAADALHGEPGALAGYQLQVGRPISPMLAQPATDIAQALSTLGGHAALEWKLDGVRVQLHRAGDDVRIYTRTLDEVTDRLPEVCAAIRALPVTDLVADGELIALDSDDRPRPFPVIASRLASRQGIELALTTYLFDLLRLDGTDLLDQPASERRAALDRIAGSTGPIRATPRLVTADPAAAADFLADTLRRGHEGVLAKALDAPYLAGRRGASWLKVKPVHTLDLVVLAVEWGSGRRTGLLSNIHLGARAADGSFIMLGKTFKGMTDEMLRWQTERFRALADGPTDGWVVRLRPEQVVEIAFDGVLRSSRYPGGVALRFARVLRYRDDKTAAEADTIETVRAFYIE